MPSISVIVPAYNEEKYLAKTLKTLRNQTFKDYELIVVDNNSKDRTNEIARKLADRVVVEKKKGYHNATNRGAKEAKGKIIAFCDADSLYPRDWLEKIMADFENNKGLVAIYGGTKFHDSASLLIFLSKIFYETIIRLSLLLGFHNPGGFNFVMKKSAYFKAGGYDSKIYNGASLDAELGRRLQKIGPLKFRPDIIVQTSSRRFRINGYFKTTLMFLIAWYTINFKKKPTVTYEQYNQIYRD